MAGPLSSLRFQRCLQVLDHRLKLLKSQLARQCNPKNFDSFEQVRSFGEPEEENLRSGVWRFRL
jgi:hypothetical protein